MVPLASLGKLIPINSSSCRGRPTSSHNRRAGWRIFATHRPAYDREWILAVNHLIVRQRQNKVFGMVVQHTKGQLVVMILAVHRVQLHVVQRVVHPAQIPLVPEPQAARSGGRVTPAKSVDSSAMLTAPGTCSPIMRLVLRRNSMASRFSRPPNSFGIHSPSLRL